MSTSALARRSRSCVAPRELGWTSPEDAEAILVFRGRELAAELPGNAAGWTDTEAPDSCGLFYRVVARIDGHETAGVVCEAAPTNAFLRGDVEENGSLNITDASAILGFLFLGQNEPGCLDAADVDDSGDVAITDAVRLLNFLFLSGIQPPAPYPTAGCDPTEDGLGCRD